MIERSAFLTPCLHPNYTVHDVTAPINAKIYSFTPCGKFLICFTINAVVIYQFNNQAGIVLDQCCFGNYFTLKAHVSLKLSSNEELSDEFCVATLDNKYVIVVTYSEGLPFQLKKSPNTINAISVQKHYYFYTISLITGTIVDKYAIKNDYIEIEQHRGVGLVQNIFAVLSLLHQTIHIIQINREGEFHLLQSIGWNLYSDDPLLQDFYPDMRPPLHNNESISALHQSILTFLYKKPGPKRLFYQEFEMISKLKIVRIQLLESMKLFIKMIPESDIHKLVKKRASYKMFVILDIPSSKVVDVFDNKSRKINSIADELVHPYLLHQLLSKNQRLDSILPLSLQRQIDSPYFDSTKYHYNYISVFDRSAFHCIKKIRFIEKGSKIDKLKFTIDPNGFTGQHPSDNLPRFTTIIAHPVLPFIITVQISQLHGTIVNLHLCCA